ncbi:ROK family protein [candidate division KSB1 bacterium]|nr:ROK family protein [candidate division KSB1 bacterium]RQW01492.1 MAG: ROK family protein [candidate division KSB1 bacterium]
MGTEFYAGLDLGGTFLKYALGTAAGKIVKKGKKPSRADETQEQVFGVMFEAIDELQKEAQRRQGELKAIGVGSPGAIDFDKGRLIGSTPNIACWANADIRGKIRDKFHLPVWADNDANIMAFAESRQGAAKGYRNVLCTTLGTGIGGGILIDGELYRGTNYAGTEIGHMMIVHDGIPCNCGGRGCFEKYASAPAMVQHYVNLLNESGKKAPKNVSTVTIFQKAAAGQAEAIAAIEITLAYLGTGFASLVNIFNPEILVVGGGVADAGDDFIARIQKAIAKRAMKPALKGFKVVRAVLGNEAGFVGGIRLAAEMFLKSR